MTDTSKTLTNHQDILAELYHEYQATLDVTDAPVDGSLKPLVTFDASKMTPVHRWFTFKEGYSPKILDELRRLNILDTHSLQNILDPFCGVGTTLLASQLSDVEELSLAAVGIEINPAIRFIAKAKLNWMHYRVQVIEALLLQLERLASRDNAHYAVPALSTFTAKRRSGKQAFDPSTLQDLLYLKEWISEKCEGIPERDFFMLAWTAAIEQASNTRKDGRALRLVPVKTDTDARSLLIKQIRLMLEDLCVLRGRRIRHRAYVLASDARQLPFQDDSFTAICYSPPYLNNIDYSEVYKLELWLRGDINHHDEFRSLRQATFRSHPSTSFLETVVINELDQTQWICRLKSALINALPLDRFRRMRKILVSGYIDDMLLTLSQQERVAKRNAPIICVVGNSLHGGKDNPQVPVCTDLLIASAAQAVGLVVDHLQIARRLPRRDNQNGWLRETVIVMRKKG